MIKYEITHVLIAHGDPKTLELLNNLASKGWEPYAITGVTHWFRRPLAQKDEKVLIVDTPKLPGESNIKPVLKNGAGQHPQKQTRANKGKK
jgi:hypothetical protein